jgi:signal transduction histidine kinase
MAEAARRRAARASEPIVTIAPRITEVASVRPADYTRRMTPADWHAITLGFVDYSPGSPRIVGPPRPPLTKRMRLGHWVAIDGLAGAVLALFSLFASIGHLGGNGFDPLVRMLLAAAVFFPVTLRRRHPVPAFCALIILAVLGAGAGQVTGVLVLLAAAYVLYMTTVTSSKRTGVAALAVALIVIALLATRRDFSPDGGGGGAYVPAAFAMIISWMTGYSVRQRRAYAAMLQHQAASSAVAEERLRIARELHDVVAHSMSVIAVQAGYGQYVIDSSPSDARDALGAIQATSRDALEEMRRMLGVLRQQDAAASPGAGDAPSPSWAFPAAFTSSGASSPPPAAPLAPAPGLGDLDRLVQRTSGAGIHVTLRRSGHVRAVPAGIDLSAYRIIQEALTNVVKHAGAGARCEVSVGYGDDAIEVRVTDDGGQALVLTPTGAALTPSSGHGLIGMRERVNLCGGEFSAGPLAAGGFQVVAGLPLHGGAP